MTAALLERAREAKHRYVWALDGRDWAGYLATLADELTVDFRSLGYKSVMTLRAHDWIAQVRKVMDGLDASHHAVSNLVVDQGPGGLAVRSYVTAQHVLRTKGEPDRLYLLAGWYDDRMTEVDGALKLTQIVFNQVWSQGDPTVMTDAVRRGRTS
ncbi:nuclear transport factor 2 family protein [Acrocarpospora catenulata]|uniref:nuclear transport factor 2 family protein n=1 Tax=Acrocarpospora catenulata TaxID=2836182 RepID=UPI001BDB2E3C|nr:nuclear transport factor 2 family protein [Acrocarpospora catenulata]